MGSTKVQQRIQLDATKQQPPKEQLDSTCKYGILVAYSFYKSLIFFYILLLSFILVCDCGIRIT